jgi:hypothetical protein
MGVGLIHDQNQEDKLLRLLQQNGDSWTSALELSGISLQYSARIFSLRRKLAEEGGVFIIENKLEIVDGRRRGFYRLKRVRAEASQAPLFSPSDLTRSTWQDPEECGSMSTQRKSFSRSTAGSCSRKKISGLSTETETAYRNSSQC